MIEMTELSDKENMNIEMREIKDMRIKWSIQRWKIQYFK